MKILKLSNQAKKAIIENDEFFFEHYWDPIGQEIYDLSPFLQKVDNISLIMDVIIARYIGIISKPPYNIMDFGLEESKGKVYNLLEAAREMRVSEKFLRHGLRMGYFLGNKHNGKWRIEKSDLMCNINLLINLE